MARVTQVSGTELGGHGLTALYSPDPLTNPIYIFILCVLRGSPNICSATVPHLIRQVCRNGGLTFEQRRRGSRRRPATARPTYSPTSRAPPRTSLHSLTGETGRPPAARISPHWKATSVGAGLHLCERGKGGSRLGPSYRACRTMKHVHDLW